MRFWVYRQSEPASVPDIDSAYMVGADGVPVRSQIAEKRGELTIKLRANGAAALSLLWDVDGFGQVMLETTRLPERDEPYVLAAELLRHQLFVLHQKFEDWGLIDLPDAALLCSRLDELRGRFVSALGCLETPAEASAISEQALADAVELGERATLYHASLFLGRRVTVGGLRRREPTFGCTIDPLSLSEDYRRQVRENFDFVQLPISWKQIEPKEKELNWDRLDNWVEWAIQSRLPIWAGPLVCFDDRHLPDWLYLWEHDFDAIRDLIYEHVSQVVHRYRNYVATWSVVSGIAADNSFNFSFDQIIEMTRMASTRTRQGDPKGKILIEIAWPWGEYHARNMRTIPPLLYADMAVQSGAHFDGIALQFFFGLGADGFYARDLLSISSMLDRFAALAKPLHVTAVQVPSDTAIDPWDAWGGAKRVVDGGRWRRDWDQPLQADWLSLFYALCLSKPYVRTVSWRDLADYEGHYLSHGGLMNADLTTKAAFDAYARFREGYHGRRRVRALGLEPMDLSAAPPSPALGGQIRIFEAGASAAEARPDRPPQPVR